jgi:hypothetical protein
MSVPNWNNSCSKLLLRSPGFLSSLHVLEFLSTPELELRFLRYIKINAAATARAPTLIPTPMPLFAPVERCIGGRASLVFVEDGGGPVIFHGSIILKALQSDLTLNPT